MIYPNSTAIPRQDLSVVVRQGQGMNKLNIGTKIFPRFGVNRMNGFLVKLGVAGMEMLRIMDKIVEPGGDIERITLEFDGQTFTLAIRKEEAAVPDERKLEYDDYFPVEAAVAQVLENKMELTHEYLSSVALFNTTTFGAATNSAVAYTEALIATMNPIRDIQDSIQRVKDKGEVPNTVVIPDRVFARMRRATLVQNFLVGQLGAGKEVTVNAIKTALADEGIEEVLIGGSSYNNAAHKATPSLTKIWPNTYIWVGRTDTGFTAGDDEWEGVESVQGVGATLYWEEYGARETETYRDEPREQNVIRGKTSEVPYVANANAGDLIATQYA